MNKLRVLSDLHHADLYYSLQLLFEKRLGAELYRPIGLDWYYEGYWNVYPHIGTAKQYLSTDQTLNVPTGIDGEPFPEHSLLNKNYRFEDGIYYVNDPTKDKINRGITLDKFKEMDFDILISSIPSHIAPFNKLISLYQPKAKHIFQIGNSWSLNHDVKNIMASCAPSPVPEDKNVVFYHQEFDLDTYKYNGPSKNPCTISSFVHYMRRVDILDTLMKQLPGWKVKMHGAGMKDHSICKTVDIAKAIDETGFVWHVKPGGDGFGYSVHTAFAMGRPVITFGHDYHGKLAGDLMIHGETCFDLDNGPLVDVLKKLADNPERYAQMCRNAHTQFKKVVNFDVEFEEIREFLGRLR